MIRDEEERRNRESMTWCDLNISALYRVIVRSFRISWRLSEPTLLLTVPYLCLDTPFLPLHLHPFLLPLQFSASLPVALHVLLFLCIPGYPVVRTISFSNLQLYYTLSVSIYCFHVSHKSPRDYVYPFSLPSFEGLFALMHATRIRVSAVPLTHCITRS